MRLVDSARGPADTAVGVSAAVAGTATQLVALRYVMARSRMPHARCTHALRPIARWQRVVFGEKVWVSDEFCPAGQLGMVDRLGLVYENLVPAHAQWYTFAQVLFLVQLAFFAAFQSETWQTCAVQNATLCCVLLVELALVLIFRIYISPLEFVWVVTELALQSAATGIWARAYTTEDPLHWGFPTGADMLTVSAWMILVWSVLGAVLTVLDWLGRLPGLRPAPPAGPGAVDERAAAAVGDEASALELRPVARRASAGILSPPLSPPSLSPSQPQLQ
eukprot:gene26477-38967_t